MNTRLVLIILLSLFLLLCFILRIMYNYDTKNNNKHNTTENFYNTNDNFNNLQEKVNKLEANVDSFKKKIDDMKTTVDDCKKIVDKSKNKISRLYKFLLQNEDEVEDKDKK